MTEEFQNPKQINYTSWILEICEMNVNILMLYSHLRSLILESDWELNIDAIKSGVNAVPAFQP